MTAHPPQKSSNKPEDDAYPGGPTWVDLENDPYFAPVVKFKIIKAAAKWLRDHVLAAVTIAILTLAPVFYITKWLEKSQAQQEKPDAKLVAPSPTASPPAKTVIR